VRFRVDAVVLIAALQTPARDEEQASGVTPPSLLQFAQRGTLTSASRGSPNGSEIEKRGTVVALSLLN
jgi:hypothetical protein